jgi:DNA-binding NarL/FixJ family response regulator
MAPPRDIVLVVDDSPSTLGMLNEALERAGYTVLVAQSGVSALDLTERVTPDIILLDAMMPGIDGFEVCRRLKRSTALAMVPVIFMTGLTETEHVITALDVGGVDYVTKPVAPDQVLARIRVHMTNARLTRSARAALDASGRFLFAADAAGYTSWCTPQAAQLLERTGNPTSGPLGEPLRGWIAACARQNTPAPTSLNLPIAIERGGGMIQVAFLGRIGPNELLLRATSGEVARPDSILREKLSLTSREAEVLLWLGRGKANRDIADILNMSPRTVSKHLEQIYVKIGVENRAAAAALVMRLLNSEPGATSTMT